MIQSKTQTCKHLLSQFSLGQSMGKKLVFEGVGESDVYNITAPFDNLGEQVIAGRVECRDSEESEIVFFHYDAIQDAWITKKDVPRLQLQDPFVTRIAGELILGGVEIFPHPEKQGMLSYRTVFYRGETIKDLKRFAIGPEGMKDIRLIELDKGKIGVCTRPQGEIGGRGQIGFLIIDSLEELTIDTIQSAHLFTEQFTTEEWGGANQLHLLKNDLIGVLGHIARFDEEGNRHYYSMTFAINPKTMQISPCKLIAIRANFPSGDAKRPDLVDVIFSGGLRRNQNKTAQLYVGASDAEAHTIQIEDPFLEYEQNLNYK